MSERLAREDVRDRETAGDELADLLAPYRGRQDLLVLGVPRGGVPVAARVAERLDCPLDVLVVRKLQVPGFEELSMGAVTAMGRPLVDPSVLVAQRVQQRTVDEVAARELREVTRRERLYREGRPRPDVRGRTVILVDDGIETGATLEAGLRSLRSQRPQELVAAAPLGAADACLALEQLGCRVVCLAWVYEPRPVRRWYARFGRVSDADVRSLLRQAAGRAVPRVSEPSA